LVLISMQKMVDLDVAGLQKLVKENSKAAKKVLNESQPTSAAEHPVFHFVLGNTSSDLDSMTCAMIYAYFKQSQEEDKRQIYLPLINIPQEDFKLRKDAVNLYEKLGFPANDCIFIDQIPSPQKIVDDWSGSVRFILVDHNRISVEQRALKVLVEEVIDHHKDSKTAYPLLRKQTIEKVDSCCTIIAKMIIESTHPNVFDDNLALALMGVILLDTGNFQKTGGRSSPQDKTIFNQLKESLKEQVDTETLYKELTSSRKNLDGFSVAQILRKDYKHWEMNGLKVGVSYFNAKLRELEKNEDEIDKCMAEWYKKNELKAYVVMTGYDDLERDEKERELGVYVEDAEVFKSIVKYVDTISKKQSLKLLELEKLKNTADTVGEKREIQEEIDQEKKEFSEETEKQINRFMRFYIGNANTSRKIFASEWCEFHKPSKEEKKSGEEESVVQTITSFITG